MKPILIFAFTILLSLSGTAIAAENQTAVSIEDMPRFASIEQIRCPKARYPSVKNRLECKHEVRREIFEKIQARQQAEIMEDQNGGYNQ